MKLLVFFLLVVSSEAVYSQNNPMYFDGIPNNNNEHFMFSVNSDTIVNGTWTQLANYPLSLFGVNSYYWPATGKIFTCGGATDSGVVKKNCYFYNPVSNTYEPADSLPDDGRWTGKLVRVKDSLYLMGSASSFTTPDGKTYKFSPAQNHWTAKSTMPLPYVHESAVCVFKDSLIICIGGSTSSFAGTTDIVRAYNPRKNTWKTLSPFPINTTSGHAECNSSDSTIVVVGGVSATFINVIYRGKIHFYNFDEDTVGITWTAVASNDSTIFHTGVYRVGGGTAGNWMLYGPALRNTSTYNTVYAVNFSNVNDTLKMFWYRMVPKIPDSAGNRPTIAVKTFGDSAYIYLFSGSRGWTAVNTSYKYSFALPVPLGLEQISAEIPDKYGLSQNFPNPFNPVSHIGFWIKESGLVTLKVYDILGREVATLVNKILKPGKYDVVFNGSNYPSGVYLCRLTAGKGEKYVFTETRKMILLK